MKKIVVLMSVLFLMSVPLFADSVRTIDFVDGNVAGGDLYISNGDVAGSDINIGFMRVYYASDPGNPDIYAVEDGMLSFNTDGSDNFIEIMGAIPDLGIGQTTLLSGYFTGWTVGKGLVEGTGPDAKAEELLLALDMPLDTEFRFYGFSISTIRDDQDPTHWFATSTDISNEVVPEPTSLILLGSGLIGAFFVVRKKR